MYHHPANSNDDETSKANMQIQIRDYNRSIKHTIDPDSGKPITLMTKKQKEKAIKEIDADIEGL